MITVHGVTWVLIRDGYVVLERCAKKAKVLGIGEWFIPGGKIEGDETPDAALQREIREEWPTVNLANYTPLPILTGSRVPADDDDAVFLMQPYLVMTVGPIPAMSGDGVPLRWTPIAEAMASPVPHVRMMVAAAQWALERHEAHWRTSTPAAVATKTSDILDGLAYTLLPATYVQRYREADRAHARLAADVAMAKAAAALARATQRYARLDDQVGAEAAARALQLVQAYTDPVF